MDINVFKSQMERIIDVFGIRYYPAERKSVIFNALRNLPDFEFKQVVTDLIGHCRQAPVLDDFVASLDKFKKQKEEAQALRAQGHVTRGLRIITQITCDQCFEYFTWEGYVDELDGPRICEYCNNNDRRTDINAPGRHPTSGRLRLS